jgi:hypothetical protein
MGMQARRMRLTNLAGKGEVYTTTRILARLLLGRHSQPSALVSPLPMFTITMTASVHAHRGRDRYGHGGDMPQNRLMARASETFVDATNTSERQ